MSDGRWVWCPPGWRVVPEVPTDEMLDTWDAAEIVGDDETVYRAIIATAPEPPSGWRQGKWLKKDVVLLWFPGTSRMEVGWAPYKDSWFAPLPPPPEEQT